MDEKTDKAQVSASAKVSPANSMDEKRAASDGKSSVDKSSHSS